MGRGGGGLGGGGWRVRIRLPWSSSATTTSTPMPQDRWTTPPQFESNPYKEESECSSYLPRWHGSRRRTSQTSSSDSPFASVESIIKQVRQIDKATRTATKWDCPELMDETLKKDREEGVQKSMGIGAVPGFLGGSGYNFGSKLASYSVYHRYQRYRWYQHHHLQASGREIVDTWDSNYQNFYSVNKCLGGCPPNAHCEWGVCECDDGFKRAWGGCFNMNFTSMPEPPRPRDQALACSRSQECFGHDMNMVCRDQTCQCREDMRWNSKALECQLYLDVYCSHLNYTTPVSEDVLTAAKMIEQKRRGWVDEADKKRKILQLPALHLATKLHGRIDVGKAYDAGNICSVVLSHQLSGCSLYSMERMLRPESRALPSNRSETPSESLEDSLLLVLSSENRTKLDADVWEEAFSHLLHLDQNEERPKNCPQINASLCAVLYDSSTCSSGSWELPVHDGTQKQLNYWSSDWKYRNDADILGVRSGCSFTGWTGSSFDGDSFSFTAGMSDRWVVFAYSPVYAAFDENILSFQCNCR